MKKAFLIYSLTFFLLSIVCARALAQKKFELPPKGIRDTAILMLQQFVIHGDRKLGFTPEEVMKAFIESDSAVSYYYINEPSILTSDDPDTLFIHSDKVMYPVKYGNSIRGSISFVRFPSGWTVREFEDSSEIVAYMNTMARFTHVREGDQNLVAVYLPLTKQTFVLEGDIHHGSLTSTDVVDTAAAKKFYSETLHFANSPRIPIADFVKNYRTHLLVVAENRKHSLKPGTRNK